jgi:hypothetical protein
MARHDVNVPTIQGVEAHFACLKGLWKFYFHSFSKELLRPGAPVASCCGQRGNLLHFGARFRFLTDLYTQQHATG